MTKALKPHLICLACWNRLGCPHAFGLMQQQHSCCWCGSHFKVYGTAYSSGCQCQDVHLHDMDDAR